MGVADNLPTGGAKNRQVGSQEIKSGIVFGASGDARLIENADQNEPSANKKYQRRVEAILSASLEPHGKENIRSYRELGTSRPNCAIC